MFQNIPPSATEQNNANMCIQNGGRLLTPKLYTSIYQNLSHKTVTLSGEVLEM
jgi:hypothetical protein